MNIKTKIALLSATGLLSVTGLVGYGTYAMFTSQAQNTANTFTAGKLTITPERDDIPQSGPMFYSNNTTTPGVVPTGLWAPGDRNTRGLFLENNGTLTGRLTTLTANPSDSSGNPLTSNSSDITDYTNDISFANQSHVKIWQVVAYDSADEEEGQTKGNGMSSTTLEQIVDIINTAYGQWTEENPGETPSTNQTAATALFDFINQDLFQDINDVTATQPDGTVVNTDTVKVVQMVDEPLINLVNNSFNVSNMNITVKPGDAALLAFTVQFDKEPPAGIDPNSMQGKSVYFNFGTNWAQTRNNPVIE